MSLSRLYAAIGPLISDNRLASVRIEDFQTPHELLLHLFVRGSVVQVSAVLDHLDATCDLGMPELSKLEREMAQEAIHSGINQCCTFLGVNFAGDLPVFCATAYDMYKGLSILEWMRFFDGVRKGRWKTEYQNISVRGLNPEFLLDWLEKFGEARDHVVQSLRRELPDNSPPVSDTLTGFEKFKEIQMRETMATNRVHEYRSAIENARKVRMVEKRSVPMDCEASIPFTNKAKSLRAELKNAETHLAKAQKDGLPERIQYLEEQISKFGPQIKEAEASASANMKWVEEDFVFDGDAPGANYRRLEETLKIYYTPFFPDQPIEQLMETIMGRWELERLVEGADESQKKAYYNTEAKKLNTSLRTIEQDTTGLIVTGLNALLERSTSPMAFMESIGLPWPGVTIEILRPKMRDIARKIESLFTSDKYCAHVDKCFESGKIPLYKKEYQTYCALWVYINTCDCQHPFHHIFND